LLAARDRTGVKIGEGVYGQDASANGCARQELVRSGADLENCSRRCASSATSTGNPDNVRHKVEWGGGGLLDIGCYPITMSRFIFGEEPLRVAGALERDPDFGTDRLSSAILEFSFRAIDVHVPYARRILFKTMHFLGSGGTGLKLKSRGNAPNDRPCRIFIGDATRSVAKVEEFPIVDQYTIQGDEFSRAHSRRARDSRAAGRCGLRIWRVIEAIFKAGRVRQVGRGRKKT